MSKTDKHTVRIVLHPRLERRGKEPLHYGLFDAKLGSDTLITGSATPIVDAAKALLDAGADPETLLTARHHDKDIPAFLPAPLVTWATIRAPKGKRAAAKSKYLTRERPAPLRSRDD